MSVSMAIKCASSGLGLHHLQLVYQRGKEEGVKQVLMERFDKVFTRFVRKQSSVTPDFFFQIFAKNILLKNIFEEKKILIVEHDFFWKIVPHWEYFGQGEDFKKPTNPNTTRQSKTA